MSFPDKYFSDFKINDRFCLFLPFFDSQLPRNTTILYETHKKEDFYSNLVLNYDQALSFICSFLSQKKLYSEQESAQSFGWNPELTGTHFDPICLELGTLET